MFLKETYVAYSSKEHLHPRSVSSVQAKMRIIAPWLVIPMGLAYIFLGSHKIGTVIGSIRELFRSQQK